MKADQRRILAELDTADDQRRIVASPQHQASRVFLADLREVRYQLGTYLIVYRCFRNVDPINIFALEDRRQKLQRKNSQKAVRLGDGL